MRSQLSSCLHVRGLAPLPILTGRGIDDVFERGNGLEHPLFDHPFAHARHFFGRGKRRKAVRRLIDGEAHHRVLRSDGSGKKALLDHHGAELLGVRFDAAGGFGDGLPEAGDDRIGRDVVLEGDDGKSFVDRSAS